MMKIYFIQKKELLRNPNTIAYRIMLKPGLERIFVQVFCTVNNGKKAIVKESQHMEFCCSFLDCTRSDKQR